MKRTEPDPNATPPSGDPAHLLAAFGLLADPVRLRLLHLVADRELAVLELADVLQLPQSTVSRHLKALSAEGWLVSRGERTANYYRMANGELRPALRKLWEATSQEIAGWSALAHDRLRLDRALAARQARGGDRFFAGVAADWDRLRTELYGDRFSGEALAAVLPPSAVVADLACGSGAVSALLAPSAARVIAVDASPEMLAAARLRLAGQSHVELERADLAALPIPDRTCDVAFLLLALTHLEKPAAALAEARRILKAGGRLVIVDLLRHDRESFRRQMEQLSNGFDIAELSSLVAEAGLTVERARPLPPAPAAKGPALLLVTAVRSDAAPDGARFVATLPLAVPTLHTTKGNPDDHRRRRRAQARLSRRRPLPRRLGEKRDSPRRAGDARPHGGARRSSPRASRSRASASWARST